MCGKQLNQFQYISNFNINGKKWALFEELLESLELINKKLLHSLRQIGFGLKQI